MFEYLKNNKNQPKLALVLALLVACLHNYLFYGNLPGISFPLFVIIFYLYVFAMLKQQPRSRSAASWTLFAVIILLSLTYVIFNNPIFYVLNILIIPTLIFIHITYIGSEKTLEWSSFRLIINALDHLIPQSLRHVPTAFRLLKSLTGSSEKKHDYKVVKSVLIGLLIAIPLLMVVIALLASADRVFEHFVTQLPNWVSELSVGEAVARLIWIFISFLLLFGYLWGFVNTYRWNEGMPSEAKHVYVKPTLDSVIVTTVLTCVNGVYLLFVIVQFSYLFGAWEGVIPEGTTFAEHARSGFIELIFVSLINFVILISVLSFERKDRRTLNTLNAIMMTFIIGCSSIMLLSAFVRLHLYEEAYGYTYIRFLVHGFMIYLAVLLVTVGLRIWLVSIPLARSFIMISLLAYVTVNYMGMDRMIAQKNIDRFENAAKIDVDYLTNLSTDAIPILINFSQEGVNMDEYLQSEYDRLSRSDLNWPSFNYSRYLAERDLRLYFDNNKQ